MTLESQPPQVRNIRLEKTRGKTRDETRDKTRNNATFQLNEELNEEIKITKIELGDRKQEVDMLQEEKEDERKEKLQLQQVAVTFNSFFS